jgi:hypothetical protein
MLLKPPVARGPEKPVFKEVIDAPKIDLRTNFFLQKDDYQPKH